MLRHVQIESDGTDIFVVANGLKIAKRGHPGTRHAKTWILLERGWSVESAADHSEIIVTHDGGVAIH
jgi:hypothetical protein